MAVAKVDFFSDVLQLGTAMTVVLPEPAEHRIGADGAERSGPPPVLYLLHGLSDDDGMWLRNTSISRYGEERGLAVVMPQVHRSFYTDLPGEAGRYWTFLSEELPAVVQRFFRVSDRREDTFVAGLSMGGYGALKWALRQPHRFAAAAGLSSVADVRALVEAGEREGLFRTVFGGDPVPDESDLLHLAGRLDAASAPRLFVCCGTEDALVDGNHRLVEALEARGVDLTTDFGPGDHEWGYWDAHIRDVLDWLPLERATAD
ncbi:alpha/beta hydrolase [Amnibacterium endophyticum]|uniref:Alpha/beta hydrolase n=1 Tax=Amnibacterium endophyticum TaxID=2109337 RepID=A0ABW4LAF5_9MICO